MKNDLEKRAGDLAASMAHWFGLPYPEGDAKLQEQILEALRAVQAEALEEAARACDERERHWIGVYEGKGHEPMYHRNGFHHPAVVARETEAASIAVLIRALRSTR